MSKSVDKKVALPPLFERLKPQIKVFPCRSQFHLKSGVAGKPDLLPPLMVRKPAWRH